MLKIPLEMMRWERKEKEPNLSGQFCSLILWMMRNNRLFYIVHLWGREWKIFLCAKERELEWEKEKPKGRERERKEHSFAICYPALKWTRNSSRERKKGGKREGERENESIIGLTKWLCKVRTKNTVLTTSDVARTFHSRVRKRKKVLFYRFARSDSNPSLFSCFFSIFFFFFFQPRPCAREFVNDLSHKTITNHFPPPSLSLFDLQTDKEIRRNREVLFFFDFFLTVSCKKGIFSKSELLE